MRSGFAWVAGLLLVIALGILLRPRSIFEPWELTELPEPGSLDAPLRTPLSLAEALGAGLGVIDFDGDGRLDVVAARAGSRRKEEQRGGLVLYRNSGQGRFEEVADAGLDAPGWCYGIGVGDLDANGYDDLYISRRGEDILFLNEGGRFRDASTDWGLSRGLDWGMGVAVADFDRDGRLDVFVARRGEPEASSGGSTVPEAPSAELPCGELLLQRVPEHFEVVGVYADTRGADGASGTAGPRGETSRPGLSADRSFASVIASDVNRDGFEDILLSRERSSRVILFGDGTGRFRNAREGQGWARLWDGAPPRGGSMDLGDIERDGTPEVVEATFRGQPAGALRLPVDSEAPAVHPALASPTTLMRLQGRGVSIFDIDNDGDLDVILAGGWSSDMQSEGEVALSPGRLLLYLGDGSDHLREVGLHLGRTVSTKRYVSAVAKADLDNDGRVDIVLARFDGPPLVVWNRLERRDWLGLSLVHGSGSPPGGIGARVELDVELPDGMIARQVRWVRRGGGYLSSEGAPLHFGLGTAGVARRLRIVWPYGRTDEHGPLQPNAHYRATEGGGLREVSTLRRDPSERPHPAGESDSSM